MGQVAYQSDGEPYFTVVSGEKSVRLCHAFAPDLETVKTMLSEVRIKSGLSRAGMCVYLGVPANTLRKWEAGTRKPCAAARRLIWVLHCLFHEHPFEDTGAWLTWSRAEVPKTEPETGTKSQVKAEPTQDLPKGQ